MHLPPQKEGFTLVETLVAISILMVSIVGPMYSVFQAVQTTYVARDQLIATSLAQEGIEFVRHQRDSNYLAKLAGGSTTWMGGLSECQVAGQSCMVDVTNIQPPTTCSGACTPLSLRADNVYAYSGTTTRFTRSVRINAVAGHPDEVVVLSTVTWINARIPYSITVTEHLYNWL